MVFMVFASLARFAYVSSETCIGYGSFISKYNQLPSLYHCPPINRVVDSYLPLFRELKNGCVSACSNIQTTIFIALSANCHKSTESIIQVVR